MPAEPVYTGVQGVPAYTAAGARPGLSSAALASFILAAFFFLGLLLFRIIDVIFNFDGAVNDATITVFGYLGLATIVLVIVVVVLGHVGMAATRVGRKRGRALAGGGLTLGYAMVAFYLVTLALAAIASSQPHSGTFIQNMLYWV
jgi:hypothetical protein